MIHVVSLNSCIDRTLTCDGFAVDKVNLTRLIHEVPAGKGVNVARILSALGTPVMLHGFVGTDRLLDFERLLASEKIKCRLISIPGRTRINTTILDGERETHIREQGEPVPAAAISSLKEEIGRKTPAGEWWVFSGSLPPGYPADELCECIRILRKNGCYVAADTSGEALRVVVDNELDLIKPNRVELIKLLDCPDGTCDMSKRAQDAFVNSGKCSTVIFSDGSSGAYRIDRDSITHACTKDVGAIQLASALGAGDALLAGYLHVLSKGMPGAEALRHGVAVATASLGAAWAGELTGDYTSIDVQMNTCLGE